MNVKLESSDKWTAKEKKKIKQRVTTIAVILGVMILVLAAVLIVDSVRKSRGLFYPDVELTDSVTGAEPQVIPADGYTQVVETPDLPYTMLTSGELVTDSDSYAIFNIDGIYAVIAEIPSNADTATYLKTAVVPALSGTASDIKVFKQKVGYINERQVESEGTTITLENGSDMYAMNMRVYVDGDKDILISAMAASASMKNAEKIVENIFYSIHETENTGNKDEDTEETDSNGDGTIEDIEPIDESSEEMEPYNDIEYDDDHVYSAINEQVNTWELPQPDSFIEGETMTFTPEGTTSDAEWIEVVYTMGSEGKNQLKEITITSPDGTVYYPDGLSVGEMGQCIYGFHVGQGMTGTGEWTVTWTAKALIGEMEFCYEKDEFWQSYYKVDMVFD